MQFITIGSGPTLWQSTQFYRHMNLTKPGKYQGLLILPKSSQKPFKHPRLHQATKRSEGFQNKTTDVSKDIWQLLSPGVTQKRPDQKVTVCLTPPTIGLGNDEYLGSIGIFENLLVHDWFLMVFRVFMKVNIPGSSQ